MFVYDELSFDNYNEKVDRIYRVTGYFKVAGIEVNLTTLPAPLAKTLINEYPGVKNTMRFRKSHSFIVRYGGNSFKESKLIFSDPELFKIFTIPLLAGNPETALKKPYTLILSKKTAEKYFGQENPIGKILKFDNKDDYMVTGIFDKIPHNSHFHFDMIISLASLEESREETWLKNNFHTYVLLDKKTDPKSLEATFPEMIKKYLGPQVEQVLGKTLDEMLKSREDKVEFHLQPLRDIHLNSDMMGELEPNSDIKYVYIFSAIALFILIIASINFINLSTARSAGRAKEVGIRKVLGSLRSHLIRQFLSESMILSFLSMLIAFLLVNWILPYFNNLTGKELIISDFFSWEILFATVIITLLTGLLAGAYPAFFMSAFQPVNVLAGQLRSGAKSSLLRSSLVVFQFITSIILIIASLAVMNQLYYIRNRDLGFDKEGVLILDNAYLLGQQAEAFKNDMQKYPQIQHATISGFLPVPSARNLITLFPEQGVASKEGISMQNLIVDYDYIRTMGMKIVKGRDFSRRFSTDTSAVIINQKAAQLFGWDEPLDKKIGRLIGEKGPMELFNVIGVVEDFHYESLRTTIGPLVMFLGESNDLISFRIAAENIPQTINLLRGKWKEFLPHQPFEYSFLDERFEMIYRAEQKLGKIFAGFAVLAVFIGCLGLFGLAAFTAEQRTKEIGIRKVLGATVPAIIQLLSKEFVVLVGIANLAAWPIAYFIMSKWLQNFAYRASLTVWIFLASGIAAIMIAVFTVGYQAVRAALANPVDSLKYE
jgi:putative ABC transport system permease protein